MSRRFANRKLGSNNKPNIQIMDIEGYERWKQQQEFEESLPNKATEIRPLIHKAIIECVQNKDPDYIQKVINFIYLTMSFYDEISHQDQYWFFGYIWNLEQVGINFMMACFEASEIDIPHKQRLIDLKKELTSLIDPVSRLCIMDISKTPNRIDGYDFAKGYNEWFDPNNNINIDIFDEYIKYF